MRACPAHVGATLLFGPRSPRPDLIGAAQLLIDDLRAEGHRISSLRVNDQTLRLRLAGLELALAVSAGPLPLGDLGGLLRRPIRSAGAGGGAEPVLTDLTGLRLIRALRQHRGALGVVLRQRGPGAYDLAGDLRVVVLALIEAAPPSLVLWQPTGVLWPTAEFGTASLAELAERGLALGAPPAAVRTEPRQLPPETILEPEPPAAALPDWTAPAAPVTAWQDRAARRSAGHLFGRDGIRPAALPRLERPSAHLAQALRDGRAAPMPARGDRPARWGGRRLRRLAAIALLAMAALMLPEGLQAMLP